MIEPSSTLVWSFATLSLLVASAFPAGLFWAARRLGHASADAMRAAVHAGIGVALWLGLTLAAASSGLLAFGPMPPPLVLLFIPIVGGALGLGFSRTGERLAMGLPLAALVGVHAFRFPLEIIMHRAYTEGVMPVQMSYSGLNFDVATGASAILLAILLLKRRVPLRVVRIWNWMGALLLLNVVVIAFLSAPSSLRVFLNEPANTWITHPPFVLLPTVMVFTAFMGHILIHRRLQTEFSGRTPTSDVVQATGETHHPADAGHEPASARPTRVRA
jgi:hypothetical protein